MRDTEGTSHGGVVSEAIRTSFLVGCRVNYGWCGAMIEGDPTFSLLAVSGSIIDRTSLTN